MEEETLKDTWAWLDEDFRFDMDSPLAISRSLWDDFASSEGVVRSLFPGPHAEYSVSPPLMLERTESSDHSSSWDIVPDCSPSPLKRRCILQLHKYEDQAYPASCTSGSLENDSSQFVGTPENMQADDSSSPNSIWCLAAEESNSSVDDAIHRSAETWMAGCLSGSDTSDVEIAPPHHRVNICINAATSKSSRAGPSVTASKSRRSIKATTLKTPSPLSHPIQDNNTPNKVTIKRRAHGKSNQNRLVHEKCMHGKANQTIVVTESTKPVLAYPFALVKPSGIQGDVTLQDINQRIKMAPLAATCAAKGSLKSLASPLLGKSVVGLTKIQTEGKGTITILRTRS